MSKQWEKLQKKTAPNHGQIWDNHTTPQIICRSKETFFFCWLFFQLSSQYICCAIAVLHSQDKTSYVSTQDYSLSKRTCKKGALSASLCKALSASTRTLWDNFDSKGYKELLKKDIWNSILQNTQFTTELSSLVKFWKTRKSVPIYLFPGCFCLLKEVSQLVTYSSWPLGTSPASSIRVRPTAETGWRHSSVD